VKNNVSKTYHVDFQTGSVTRVDVKERVGIFADSQSIENSDIDQTQWPIYNLSSGPMKMPPLPEKVIDAVATLQRAISEFEEQIDAKGVFDPTAYSYPTVQSDAVKIYKMLEQEIPMLEDVMSNIRDILKITSGVDPMSKKKSK
jgi:hypothetical protein